MPVTMRTKKAEKIAAKIMKNNNAQKTKNEPKRKVDGEEAQAYDIRKMIKR